MNRKQFIRNSMFGLAAAFVPKIFMSKTNHATYSGRYPFGYVIMNRKDGETAMGLSEAEYAKYKLQYMIMKKMPPGKYIDLNYVKNALHGMD